MATSTTVPRVVDPPFYDPPIVSTDTGQQHSQAWTEYHQAVADQLANVHNGVTDGSDASAGQVGEYQELVGDSIGLSSTVTQDGVALTLQPGDWEVWGQTSFSAPSGTTGGGIGTGIDGIDTLLASTWLSGAKSFSLPTGRKRVSNSSAQAVYVKVYAAFSGSMTAVALIRARRMR